MTGDAPIPMPAREDFAAKFMERKSENSDAFWQGNFRILGGKLMERPTHIRTRAAGLYSLRVPPLAPGKTIPYLGPHDRTLGISRAPQDPRSRVSPHNEATSFRSSVHHDRFEA